MRSNRCHLNLPLASFASFFKPMLIAAAMIACAGPMPGGSSQPPTDPIDPLSGIIRFYQGPLNHLSAVRRGECPMAPSCSEYARLAIAAHGPWIGWMMAHDRLLRCGRDEAATAPRVLVNGRWKIYDPPAANDFWWREAPQ
jgi:putative component of membrane protein insertase Oxa1/YidC/SpoIIIJ protein YidD